MSNIINVLIGLFLGLLPFAVSHIILQRVAIFVLIVIVVPPMLALLVYLWTKYSSAPVSFVIPLLVLPILSRTDISTPPLVIFTLALVAIVVSSVSTASRCSHFSPWFRHLSVNRAYIDEHDRVFPILYLALMALRVVGGSFFYFVLLYNSLHII